MTQHQILTPGDHAWTLLWSRDTPRVARVEIVALKCAATGTWVVRVLGSTEEHLRSGDALHAQAWGAMQEGLLRISTDRRQAISRAVESADRYTGQLMLSYHAIKLGLEGKS